MVWGFLQNIWRKVLGIANIEGSLLRVYEYMYAILFSSAHVSAQMSS